MDFLPTREHARVDTGLKVYERVRVTMPPGRTTAQIWHGPEFAEEKPGALQKDAVTQLNHGLFTIDFEDGSKWTIEDLKKPCGCG